MRVSCRRLAPGELDHEAIWLGVSLGSLAFLAGWLELGLPWPHCVFLRVTGHPCVSCGASRCAIAFFHGELLTALRWNPLVFIGLCALSIFDVYAFAVIVTRRPRLRMAGFDSKQKNILRLLVVLTLAANWIYLLSRPRGTF